ncbi:MAG: glycosyltransferase family 2 protein [Candidatus Omnitrophica bacterium]|nr:glycosyltransferase family 2 protein [Candidatus Omnitrophota bacterium]
MVRENNIYLSIVIPAYNEGANIAFTLQDVAQYLKNKNYAYEIIVVNDGSLDETATLAALESKLFAHFTLLEHSPNRGKGYSVKEGVSAAKGELILFMDADNSTRINQIEGLMSAIIEGYDIAIASRRLPGAIIETRQPFYRIILGNIYILLSRLILGTAVNDYNCGFKLYKKAAAKLLFSKLVRDDWSFDSELIYLIFKHGLKIKEVPVRWHDKKKTSKVRPLRDGIKSLCSLFKIRFTRYQRKDI